MGLAITLVAALAVGYELSLRIWKRDEPGAPAGIERLLDAWLLGSLIAIACTWTFALVRAMEPGILAARSVVFAIVAAGLLVSRWRRDGFGPQLDLRSRTLYAFALVPLALLVAYALWRGFVTPPASIDALSYHLPKALLYANAGGYDPLRGIRYLISWRPSNYELQLAEGILLEGSDRTSEWLSTFYYCGFVLSAGALAQRWWGRSTAAVAAVMLAAGSVPVALLHVAHHKNDVMTAFFLTAALVMLGRWLSDLDLCAFVVAVAALGAAAGTKTPAAIAAAFAIPLLLWPFVRGRVPLVSKRIILALVVSLVAVLLLGGVSYLTKLGDRSATIVESTDVTPHGRRTSGHYANFWKAPVLLLTQPFSPDAMALRVPWSPEPWMWRRYQMYYSELGIPFALCALAMPVCIWRLRGDRRGEAIAVTLLTFAAFAAILPFDSMPAGRYLIGLPRFALPIVPIVFAWTLAPLAMRLEAKRPGAEAAMVGVLAVIFGVYAVKTAVHDSYAPFDFAVWSSRHPERRLPPLAVGRATAVVDEMAGPRDRVAFDGGVSSMIHLASGRDLKRPIEFIPPGAGSPVIGDDVQWVVVDRGWNVLWGNSAMTDMSQAPKFLSRGKPTAADLRVLRAMAGDPRFEIVYSRPQTVQFVFRRKPVSGLR